MELRALHLDPTATHSDAVAPDDSCGRAGDDAASRCPGDGGACSRAAGDAAPCDAAPRLWFDGGSRAVNELNPWIAPSMAGSPDRGKSDSSSCTKESSPPCHESSCPPPSSPVWLPAPPGPGDAAAVCAGRRLRLGVATGDRAVALASPALGVPSPSPSPVPPALPASPDAVPTKSTPTSSPSSARNASVSSASPSLSNDAKMAAAACAAFAAARAARLASSTASARAVVAACERCGWLW